MREDLIVIDFSYMLHRSSSIIKYNYNIELDLSVEADRGYLIRKVMMDLTQVLRELQGDNVVICLDSRSFRYSLLETYKSGRGEKDANFVSIQQEIFNIFNSKDLNALRIPGLEADDLIALTLSHPLAKKYRIFVITADEDMQSLIDENIMVFDPKSTVKTFYYRDDAQIKFKPKEGDEYKYKKVDPEYIQFMKIMKGCSSDTIPQITPKGYRTKKIDMMYEIYKETEGTLYEKLMAGINSQDLVFTEEQLNHQLSLVCLRREYFPEQGVKEFENSFQIKDKIVNYDMVSVLEGSPYVTEDYKATKAE